MQSAQALKNAENGDVDYKTEGRKEGRKMGTDQIRELGKQTPNGLHTVALWSCISPSILRAAKLKIHTGKMSNKCNQKWVYTHHTEHYSETSRLVQM